MSAHCTRPMPRWRCRRRATSTRGGAKASRSGSCPPRRSLPRIPATRTCSSSPPPQRSTVTRPSTRCRTRLGTCDDHDRGRGRPARAVHAAPRRQRARAGHRLSQWCGHAPTLEEDIALANMALDLIGQARLLYAYAAEVEDEGRDEDQLAYLRDAGQYRNLLLTEQPNGDFAFTIARQSL